VGFPSVDTIRLGNDLMPGQWVLMPGGREFGWQEQKGWGLAGATVRPIGDELAHPTFLVKFWSAADWDLFQVFRLKYLQKQAFGLGAARTYAIGIFHPELNSLGITSVVVKRTPWFVNNGRGLWSGIVEFTQYRKPQPVLETPKASIPAAQAPTPSAQDQLEREMVIQQNAMAGAR
jgi:hypothetical protein